LESEFDTRDLKEANPAAVRHEKLVRADPFRRGSFGRYDAFVLSLRAGPRGTVFRDCSFFASEYWVASLSVRDSGRDRNMKMNAQATKLETAENDLKRLMADVTRAMEKAEEAIGRIAPRPWSPQQRRNPSLRRASP
jgi:hypothetical protein